jgi:hypothetical protein
MSDDDYCDGCGRELCMCPPPLYAEYFASDSSPYTLDSMPLVARTGLKWPTHVRLT